MYSSYTTLFDGFSSPNRNIISTPRKFFSASMRQDGCRPESSLQDQLHRKFFIDGQPPPRSPRQRRRCASGQGRPFLMPTALSCFADALRSGADYVTSDAVFGYSGVTTLYHSQGFCSLPGLPRLPELLRRCQAEPATRKIPSNC